MRGLVQSLMIGELCQNRSGLLALANDPHHFEWVLREHTIQISDRRLLLKLAPIFDNTAIGTELDVPVFVSTATESHKQNIHYLVHCANLIFPPTSL